MSVLERRKPALMENASLPLYRKPELAKQGAMDRQQVCGFRTGVFLVCMLQVQEY